MSLAEGSGGTSALAASALGDLLAFFGCVADYAAGEDPGNGERIASLAASIAALDERPEDERNALFFAALLRNAGALGNPALVKGSPLDKRAKNFALQRIPVDGARLCEQLGALSAPASDMVRWQAERWDGTGYPDRLRWAGIPAASQYLHIAIAFARERDPHEGLARITSGAGRWFSPQCVRTFVTWFHLNDARIVLLERPDAALDRKASSETIASVLADRIDAHNGTPGRSTRMAQIVTAVMSALGADPERIASAASAARFAAIGELREERLADEAFDPLSRLGIESRAANAVRAAEIAARIAHFAEVAEVLSAQAEWFDGTGAPRGLRGRSIPAAAQAIALASAYVALDPSTRLARIDAAAGTQFDPSAVAALIKIDRALQ